MVQLFHTYQKPLWKGLPTPLNVKIKSQLKLGGNGPLLYRPTQIGTQTDPNQNGQDRKEIYAPHGTILICVDKALVLMFQPSIIDTKIKLI